MSIKFPNELDSFIPKRNYVDDVFAEHINLLQEAIEIIEQVLGTGIHGANNSLSERLNLHFDNKNAHHSELHNLNGPAHTGQLHGGKIKENTLPGAAILSGSISSSKLEATTDEKKIQTIHLAPRIVTSNILGERAVATINVAENAITSDKIKNEAILPKHISTISEFKFTKLLTSKLEIGEKNISSQDILILSSEIGIHVNPGSGGNIKIGENSSSLVEIFNQLKIYGNITNKPALELGKDTEDKIVLRIWGSSGKKIDYDSSGVNSYSHDLFLQDKSDFDVFIGKDSQANLIVQNDITSLKNLKSGRLLLKNPASGDYEKIEYKDSEFVLYGNAYVTGYLRTGYKNELDTLVLVSGDTTNIEHGDICVISGYSGLDSVGRPLPTVTKSSSFEQTSIIAVKIYENSSHYNPLTPLGEKLIGVTSGTMSIKASNINGAITTGCPLTTSSVPGTACKANSDTPAAAIIGKSLVDFDESSGLIPAIITKG